MGGITVLDLNTLYKNTYEVGGFPCSGTIEEARTTSRKASPAYTNHRTKQKKKKKTLFGHLKFVYILFFERNPNQIVLKF